MEPDDSYIDAFDRIRAVVESPLGGRVQLVATNGAVLNKVLGGEPVYIPNRIYFIDANGVHEMTE